ncbi:MAG: hypothetical protein AAGG75_10485 [Bacteroidota bacterium]
MKNLLILPLVLLFGGQGYAQQAQPQFPLSISYFSHTLYQPGVKLGTQWTFRSWPAEGSEATKQHTLYLSPQIAYYTHIDNYSNYLINAELGYRRLRLNNRRYIAFSIGMGYLARSNVRNLSVNLGDGSTSKQREWNHYFLPNLNFEFGRKINDRAEWFSKWTYGLATNFGQSPTSMVFVELGARFFLFQ